MYVTPHIFSILYVQWMFATFVSIYESDDCLKSVSRGLGSSLKNHSLMPIQSAYHIASLIEFFPHDIKRTLSLDTCLHHVVRFLLNGNYLLSIMDECPIVSLIHTRQNSMSPS